MAIAQLDSFPTIVGTTISPSTLSYAFSVSSGATLLVVCVFARDGGGINTVSWNSVACSQAAHIDSAGGLVSEIWYLYNPGTGSHNIDISTSGQTWIASTAGTFTGTPTTGSPDAQQAVETNPGDPSFSGGTSLTTVTDGCVVIDCLTTNSAVVGDISMSAETNRVLQQKSQFDPAARVTAVSMILPKSPAGSCTMGWTVTGSNTALTGAAFAPASGGSAMGAAPIGGIFKLRGYRGY